MGGGRARWTRTTTAALVGAVVWSSLLVVAAFVAPAYSTAGVGADGSATLVGVNGYGVLLVVSMPLVATLVAAWALSGGRHRRLGWVVTSVLCVVTVLSSLSVGIFFLPATMALLVACAATPRASRAAVPVPS